MTKSSRQAAIAGYLKRDDGIDWKGLTDYANSMYDVRDELEVADVEDNFDIETAQKAIKSKTPYLTLRPLQINPAEFRKDLQKLQDAFIEKGVINVDEQVAKLKALDWNKLTDATIKLAGEDPTAFYEVATKEVLGEEADEDMMAVIAGLLLNVLRRYFRNLGEDMTHELSKVDEAKSGDAPLGCRPAVLLQRFLPSAKARKATPTTVIFSAPAAELSGRLSAFAAHCAAIPTATS